jgi:hypothetical protein
MQTKSTTTRTCWDLGWRKYSYFTPSPPLGQSRC